MNQKKIITYILNSIEYIGTAKHPKREQLNQIVTIEQGTNYVKSLHYLIKKTGYCKLHFISLENEIKKLCKTANDTIIKTGRYDFCTPKNNYCITTKTTVVTNFELEL